jgi:membrane protein YqaA with SNARE-associated domain
MWMYPAVFLASMGVDLIPVFAPPAWTVMVFFLVKFRLNPWLVLVLGVCGSTLGRYFFSLYIPKVSDRIIKRRKNEELEFVGKKLGGTLWKTWLFVLIYTLLPLSTTALFTAAGLARIKPLHTLPPFFVGKFASDALMIMTGKYLASNSGNFLQSLLTPKTLITLLLGLVVLGAVLFVDWFALLKDKKLKFRFKILK